MSRARVAKQRDDGSRSGTQKVATGYPGGKGGAGIFQRLINLIPPHDTYAAIFAGFDAVARFKKPARRTVLCDLHRPALVAIAAEFRDVAGIEALLTDGVSWLRHECRMDDMRGITGKDPDAEWSDCTRSDLFIFADPPYPRWNLSRAERIYAQELDEAGHVRLLETLYNAPCPCMVTCYPCALYDDALLGWHAVDYMNCTRGGPKLERLWCNYPPPARLHDARYVGTNKRQRERIRRRRISWTAGLRRAGPLERQAIRDAIDELG